MIHCYEEYQCIELVLFTFILIAIIVLNQRNLNFAFSLNNQTYSFLVDTVVKT